MSTATSIDDNFLKTHPFDIHDVSNMKLVAEGRMGTQVLKGNWRNKYVVAIKRVPFDTAPEQQQLKQLEYDFIQQHNEFDTICKIANHFSYLKQHENVLPCYGYQIFENHFFYMYPLMDTDLFDVVLNNSFCNTGKKISDAKKWSWIAKIAKGLLHFHKNNLCHGDIKASNILVPCIVTLTPLD